LLAGNAAILDFETKRVELRFKKLANRLFSFMDWPEMAPVGSSGLSMFIDSVGHDPTEPESPDDAGMENEFVEWLLLDYVDADVGATAANMFLENPDDELADWEVASLEQWAGSAPRLYEIAEVLSGSRLLLRDVLADTTQVVVAPQISATALKWSLYMARLLRVDDVYTVGATVAVLPRRMLGYVWRMLGRVYRGMKSQGYEGGIDDFLKGSALNLMKLMRAFTLPLAHGGSDEDDPSGGPDSSLACSEISVDDGCAVLEALNTLAAVRPAGEGFVWVRTPRRDDFADVVMHGRSDVAYIKPVDGGIRVYSTGRGVPAAVMASLRRLSVGAARGRKRVRKPAPDEASEALAVIDAELVKLGTEHYSTWPDTPKAVLRGETPRSATATAIGRRFVGELLKDLEYHEDLKRRAGLAWVDVERLCRGALREELDADDAPADGYEAQVRVVEALVSDGMRQDGYSIEQVFVAARMWHSFAAAERPRIGRAKSWAAGVEYSAASEQKEPVTQAAVAAKYGVSVSTVGEKSRTISAWRSRSEFSQSRR
jgi:hypothetical protein